ncbi:MAG: type II toxin-antitoxin system BrnA family antitoxin [Terriglobia bacterium]
MKNNPRSPRPVSAEAIAKAADRGKDVSRYFTNKGRMMEPIQRVNVDFRMSILKELDAAAEELNVSRQAVIKTLIRQGLDQHYLAKGSR